MHYPVPRGPTVETGCAGKLQNLKQHLQLHLAACGTRFQNPLQTMTVCIDHNSETSLRLAAFWQAPGSLVNIRIPAGAQ